MNKLLIPAVLLMAASCSGVTSNGLTTATGDRLTDYTNWFAPQYKVASDANYIGAPYPRWGIPTAAAMSNSNRAWSGWSPNFGGSALGGPMGGAGSGQFATKVEFVFLGETAGWWDDIGYRRNGVDYLLADGVQTAGASFNRSFGDYAEMTLNAGETLDFFITGSGIKKQDGVITTGSRSGKFFVFDETANSPVSASMQSYYGVLQPLSSVRSVNPLTNLTAEGFTVLGFEDIRLNAGADRDYNDLLFAIRSASVSPCCLPVPEPSAYGLIGAVALGALIARRRFRRG